MFQVGMGLAQNTATLLILRLLGGIFAAAPLANSGFGAGAPNDERGIRGVSDAAVAWKRAMRSRTAFEPLALPLAPAEDADTERPAPPREDGVPGPLAGRRGGSLCFRWAYLPIKF